MHFSITFRIRAARVPGVNQLVLKMEHNLSDMSREKKPHSKPKFVSRSPYEKKNLKDRSKPYHKSISIEKDSFGKKGNNEKGEGVLQSKGKGILCQNKQSAVKDRSYDTFRMDER